MAYFIKQIPNNTYNKYKYNYLDHVEAVIDMRDNYWSYLFKLFCINQSNLPLNSLTLDMQLPYQEVNNVLFNLSSDQSTAKDNVKANKAYAKQYEAKFNVDISQNQYLKQNLNNAKVNIGLALQMDPQTIAKGGFSPSQDDLDGLINETSEQRFDFTLFYTNNYEVTKSGKLMNNYSYSLAGFSQQATNVSRIVDVSINDYLNNKQAITNLVNIQSQTPFQVVGAKVKFNYLLDDSTEAKTLESELNIPTNFVNNIDINFDKQTDYDFTNNKVIIDPLGINGFYIPRASHGDYELTLKICQEGNTNTFIVKNKFIFSIQDLKPYIGCCQILINNLNGYKEIRF